jgi:DNA-binding SARP family transcriptional activator
MVINAIARWELRLLGHPELRCGDGRLIDVPTKAFAVAARLLLDRPNQQCLRSELAAFLWPDADSPHQRANLRTLLKRIRVGIGGSTPSPFVIDGESIAFNPDAVRCDLSEFQRLLASDDASDVAEAAALFSGQLIEARDRESAAFERWLGGQRSSLSQTFQAAAGRALESGGLDALPEKKEALAQRLIKENPNDEAGHRALLQIYASRGDYDRVRATYHDLAHSLGTELGSQPSEETRALYRSLADGVDEAADPRLSNARGFDRDASSLSAPFISFESRCPVLLVPSTLARDGGSAVSGGANLIDDLLAQLWKLHALRIVVTLRDDSAFAIGRNAGGAGVYSLHFALSGQETVRFSTRLMFDATADLLWTDSLLLTEERRDQVIGRVADAVVGAIEDHQIEAEKSHSENQRTSFALVAQAERALTHIDLPSVRRARRLLRRAAQTGVNPSRAQARLARALWMEWLMSAGRNRSLLTTARGLARSALEALPESHYGHQELGMTVLYLGQYERALEHLSDARDLNPLDSQLLFDFAYASIANGQAKEALSSVEAGRSTDRRLVGFRNWVAACGDYATCEYEAAIAELLELRSPGPADRLLAACYAMLGEREKAKECKDKYLKVDPRFSIDSWISQCPLRAKVDVDRLREGHLRAGFR